MDEYLPVVTDGYGLRVMIHNSKTIPSPGIDGLFIQAGHETSVGLKQVCIFNPLIYCFIQRYLTIINFLLHTTMPLRIKHRNLHGNLRLWNHFKTIGRKKLQLYYLTCYNDHFDIKHLHITFM